MVHNRRKRSDPASTKSSKSEVVAHDNDVAAKLPLTDAKHPTTIDSLLPEHEPTDTTDKRLENCQTVNNFFVSFQELNLGSADSLITFPEHEPTDTNDKRLEDCQTVNNLLLSIRLSSTFSLTNITLPEHEPADTNDKRLEKCQAENIFIISYMQLYLDYLKTMFPYGSTPSTSSTLDKCQAENCKFIFYFELILNSLKAVSSGHWTLREAFRSVAVHVWGTPCSTPPMRVPPHPIPFTVL
ncbi:uncharacterized protein [Temnothorax nylanderi]